MWTWLMAAALAALLPAHTARANSGLSAASFSSNELRSGFSRLYRTGLDQPFTTPFGALFDAPEYQTSADPALQQFRRPAPFGPTLAATGFKYPSRPRFHPGGGRGGVGRKPNDVLVIVVKVSKNCTAVNGTESNGGGGGGADDDGDDDDDDSDEDNDDDEKEGGLNPDDEVESVTVVAGGAEKNKEPSRCVWAILSCCAPSNANIRYTCFDILGCSTAFWDTNPCVPAVIKTVLDQATAYYGGGSASPNRTATTVAPPTTTMAAAASDGLAALASGTVATTLAAATSADAGATPAPAAT